MEGNKKGQEVTVNIFILSVPEPMLLRCGSKGDRLINFVCFSLVSARIEREIGEGKKSRPMSMESP